MEIEIIAKRPNPFLKRMEVKFKILHLKEGVPKRTAVKEKLSEILKTPADKIIVDHIKSEFGKMESKGYAKIYERKEDAISVERKHILLRNKLIEAKKEVKKKSE